MKRRIFRASSTAPSHIPIGLHGPQDISRAKRGKYMDWENAHPPSCRADADASLPIGGTQGTRCDDPKTSEYAYFRKLKTDASQSFCPLLKEDDQLKKFKSIDSSKETKNMGKDSSKDLKSSLHIKEFTPINFNSFLSLHGDASKNSGTQCIDEGAFSRKRQKLRQWVDTSFPEIDVLCSKGYNFISVILSRLSPNTSENKGSKGQKLVPMEIDTKSKSLAFSESYIHSNKLQYSLIQNFRGLESGQYLDDGSTFCQISKSKEKLPWKWDLGSDHPTCPPSKFHLQYQKEKPDCDLDGESSACLWTENDSTSGFSFEKYGLSSKGQKLLPMEIDTKSKSLAFSESYIHSNKLQYSPIQNFRGLESGPYLDDGSSFCQIGKSKEKLLWKWDLGSDPPTCPPSKFHLQYQKEKPDCDLDGESSSCLWTENDSTSGFSFEKYGLSSKGQKLLPMEIDTKSKSLAFSESYIHSNKLQYSPIQNFRGLESGPYLDDGSSFCQIGKSKEKLLWKWDLGSDPPTCPPSKFHLQYQKEKPDCDLDGESSSCLWTENDSTSGFSFEKYGLVVSSHLKELSEFHDQKELMLGREPHSLLLDWDFDNMKGDEILSIASPNMELDMDSTLPISLADYYWQSGDNRFDASGLFPSSLLSYTSSHSYSDSYHNYDHVQHSLEERKCLVAKLHHFPLTLSYCPNLTEDCTYDNTCKDGSIVCSPEDHHWSMSMFFNEKQHPGLEALLLSSGFDYDLRQKHLLLTDYPGEHHSSAYQALQFPQKEGICSHFVEDEFTNWLDNSNHKETLGHFPGDILNIRDWSSINLLMSLNKEKALPLLLDKSSWAASEAEMDIDDCEGNHT